MGIKLIEYIKLYLIGYKMAEIDMNLSNTLFYEQLLSVDFE
jgi:hypothetical protein